MVEQSFPIFVGLSSGLIILKKLIRQVYTSHETIVIIDSINESSYVCTSILTYIEKQFSGSLCAHINRVVWLNHLEFVQAITKADLTSVAAFWSHTGTTECVTIEICLMRYSVFTSMVLVYLL